MFVPKKALTYLDGLCHTTVETYVTCKFWKNIYGLFKEDEEKENANV